MIEHRDVVTNGVRLHVALAGPEDGRPVLLLHGFPDFWYGWHGQIEALAAAGFRVLAPDQRGYNTSDKPRRLAAYGRDALAADAVGLLDALGIHRASVVGHDWGGAVAWWMGHQYPERVDKLVVINCPHPAVMARALRTDLRQLRRSWYILFFQLPWLPEWYFGRAGLVPATRWLARVTGLPPEHVARYREAWSQPGALRAMIHWYRAAARLRAQRPRHRSILARTLLVWGTNDFALGEEMVQPSIERCADGRIERIEGGGHWVHVAARERVNALLTTFLNPGSGPRSPSRGAC